MKPIKARYDYLFLYLLITATSIAISYFFPESVILVLRTISALFLLCALFLLISRYGNYRLPGTSTYSFWQSFLLWLCLQIGVFCILLVLFYGVIATPSATSFDTITILFKFYLLSGFFPWPFYLLLGLAFAYFGRKNHKSPLLSALWPIFGSRLNTSFGLGIDLYAKQGVLFTSALILGIGVVLLVQWLSPENSETVVMPNALLASFIIFMLLGSVIWRRFTRYLWTKRCPLALFLTAYLLLLIAILIVCTVFLSYLNLYLLHLPLSNLIFRWPERDEQANSCLLMLLGWAILAAPIIASYGAKLMAGQTIRTVTLQALLLPCLLGVLIVFDHYWWNEKGMDTLIRFVANQTIAFIALGISLVTSILFFRLPDTKYLVVIKPSVYPSLSAIRNFCLILAGVLIAYLLTGVPFLILFICSIMLPVFISVCGTCIALIRSLDF